MPSLLSANDSLGAPASVIKVSAVDLANPKSNVTNEITNTTTPAPTGNIATTVAPLGALIPELSVREACVQRIIERAVVKKKEQLSFHKHTQNHSRIDSGL